MKKLRRMFARLVAPILVLALAGWLGLKLVPIPAALSRPPVQSRELLDRRGQTLREVRVEERFSREVALAEVPAKMVHAMLAAEDKRFISHAGVDLLAVARSTWSVIRHGRVTSGASTITQQLVKLAEPRPRNWRTKIIEAVTALRLEQVWTKDRILAAYLNRLDFGNLNIGVTSASDYYFGKPLADLTDAEAAFLAALPRNPRRLNPHTARAAAERRQQTVLRRMHAAGWLEGETVARAEAEPLQLRPPRRTFRAPHFVDLVLRDLPGNAPATIQTTLDLELNRFVDDAVHARLAALRGQIVRDAAVVVIHNPTGEVRALIGSGDYFAPGTGQVNGAWARRSPGSTIKPFSYLLALEKGATPATIVADVPTVFATSTGLYRPENYGRRSFGPMRYRLALGNSLNIPAVKVLASIGGPPVLAERLRNWGITSLDRSPEEYGLGLTIGNAEVRLLELTNAYAALARLGEYRPFRLTSGLAQAGAPSASGLASQTTPEAAWLLADMLSDNAARVLAFGADSPLRFDFPVACKTGTSTDFRDNWALGFTPEFTVGIWVGNFDGSAMREVSGVTGAAPILHAVFNHLHARHGTTWYARPATIVEREVHPLTGKLLKTPRPEGVKEMFFREHLPPMETTADYDAEGRAKLGPEYQSWLESAENFLTHRAAREDGKRTLRLVSPLPGTTFILDPDVPTTQQIPLVATGFGRVVWESSTLRCAEHDGQSRALASEGEHRLMARDPSTGEQLETWIRVKAL